MTISTALRKAGPFTGNGATTAFPFSFKVFAATDATVTVANTQGNESVLALGADLPVCLAAPAPQRMRGIGEDLAPLAPLPEVFLTLVNPGVAVPTGQVFARLAEGAGTDNPCLVAPPPAPDFDAFTGWLAAQRNDLEAPAAIIAPVIDEALAALRAVPDCRLARMSGSGSTVFGLFDSARRAERAAANVAAARPGWWVRATRLLAPAGRGV